MSPINVRAFRIPLRSLASAAAMSLTGCGSSADHATYGAAGSDAGFAGALPDSAVENGGSGGSDSSALSEAEAARAGTLSPSTGGAHAAGGGLSTGGTSMGGNSSTSGGEAGGGGEAGTSSSAGSGGEAGTPSSAGTASSAGSGSTDGATLGDLEFSPYFYAWGWGNPAYPFEGLADLKAKAGVSSVTLAFVLASGECSASRDIQDHLSDVDAFRASGGHVKASFGGANGTYLENACADAESLAEAIGGFVTETGIIDLDFDVEQAGAMDSTVNLRRAEALRLVQESFGIQVSYTLAATPRDQWDTPGGISRAGVDVLSATLDAQVTVTRVNLMTMDYGPYYSTGSTMAALAASALTDACAQLQALVPGLSESGAWQMLGATPMIGQNDVSSEVFTLDDARTLIGFATEKGLGLVSFWAINRDQPCPYEDLAVCSMVNTRNFEYSDIFRGVD